MKKKNVIKKIKFFKNTTETQIYHQTMQSNSNQKLEAAEEYAGAVSTYRKTW